jgi:hypothetical protein
MNRILASLILLTISAQPGEADVLASKVVLRAATRDIPVSASFTSKREVLTANTDGVLNWWTKEGKHIKQVSCFASDAPMAPFATVVIDQTSSRICLSSSVRLAVYDTDGRAIIKRLNASDFGSSSRLSFTTFDTYSPNLLIGLSHRLTNVFTVVIQPVLEVEEP